MQHQCGQFVDDAVASNVCLPSYFIIFIYIFLIIFFFPSIYLFILFGASVLTFIGNRYYFNGIITVYVLFILFIFSWHSNFGVYFPTFLRSTIIWLQSDLIDSEQLEYVSLVISSFFFVNRT